MPSPTLLIIGAGHVGRAVAELATWLEVRTVVWDDRDAMVRALAREIDEVAAVFSGPIDDVLDAEPLGPADAIVIVTRNADLDLLLLPTLLATTARYVGLMGSGRRWATTRSRLREAGVTDADLDRVHTPIGLEIHAETPEEIGESILTEVMGVLRAA